MPTAMAQLTSVVPPHRRARALGVFSGVTGLAVLGGPVVGGAITQGLDWHWIFWLNVPIAAVLVPLVLARMPGTSGPARSVDVVGLVLVSAASLALVWGLTRSGRAGWASAEVVGSLALAVLLAGAFVGWERRVAAPMVPLGLFRARGF